MRRFWAFVSVGYFLVLFQLSGSVVNRGYIFTAPKKFLAGEIESGCLSLHNLEPPAHVVLELLSPSSIPKEEVLAATSNIIKTGIETCLELMVPSTKYSNARLRLKIKFTKHPDYTVETEKTVYIEHDSLITFVETDKSVYKPGQDVNIRVLMLKHDLKPWKKTIPKIWIENPSEVRVAQWTNVTTESGIVQLVFPLSAEPTSGMWKIKLEKKKFYPQLLHTTTFEVKKYVLPRFQLTISSPGYILADAENVTWNICVKYSFGKPVKGTLLLKSTPQTPSWRRKLNLPEIHYETELDTPDGCTEFVLSGAVLGLADWKVAPNNIVLIANFTEAGTSIVKTAISRTAVVHQALKLEFASYTPKHFKLGLPYHGKLRVLRQDDIPAPNEKIQLCLRVRGKDERLRVVVECRNFTSSSEGFVDFIVPPPHKNIVLLSFVATGVDYPTKYYSPDKRWRVFMHQPSAYIDVNPWYSPSDSYITVARGYQPIVCGEKYSFNVMYTMPINSKNNESISFHYSINSKGDLLIYGHVKHKPTRDTVLNYSEFRNLLGAVETPANKTEQGPIVHRFPLSVKVTPSMAPLSELLLYYVRPDGEIVATTYTIEVGHCFENKVKTAWHTDVQTPGKSTQYHVEAAPWSFCGISVVDKSTLFMAGSKANLVNAGQAFDQLKRFHLDPETRPVWTWSHCKATTKSTQNGEEMDHLPSPAFEAPHAWDWPRRRKRRAIPADVNYVDALQAFDDFGAVVMSDLIIETRPCPQFFKEFDRMFKRVLPKAFPLLNFEVTPAAMGPELEYIDQLPNQAAPLRSYFPETWLWELVQTGKEGKSTIDRSLPHTITDWVGHTVCISPIHGLGVAQPTTITAFQPFFLDYSLPYSVKRGEMLHLKVSLFNYMQHSLPVKIKLEDATGLDLHLSHATASFCVKPRDSVVREYILRPRVLGEVNITVSASIDSDYAEPCGPEALVFTRDVIVKSILVLPEGFPVEMTKSAFICPKDFSDDSTITWTLELPEDVVPESGRAYVSLIGDILGPALENLEHLVRLPMGCGEQNMILFVPNIHVISYFDALKIENPALRAKAIKNMEKGYQRELSYKHSDGSYSAFGPDASESDSSIWLTAFVVKSFAQARSLIHIDDRDLKLSVKWIVKKQLENGCFPITGRVFHKDMKGGLQDDDNSSTALTAYILISLLESDVPLSAALISNALYCLEKDMTNNNSDLYTAALTTYTLALLEHPKANNSMKQLMTRATQHNDLLWWEDKSKTSTGLSIEITAYAVLSLIKLGGEDNMVCALKSIRWMSKQRNAEGGFTSTQDTVLGLEALTKYAIAMGSGSTDLSVLVTANDVDHVYRVHNENRMVLTHIRLPVLPTIVEIFAEGNGCVLVQSNLKYNVPRTTGSEAFDLSVVAEPVSFTAECSMQKITVCARYKLADEESNMALLEIGMISGYVPDRTTLHALLEEPTSRVKRFEEDRDIVTIYFDKLTGETTCITFTVIRENIVNRLEPTNVKLYDYYQQELMVTSNYGFAPTCSSADLENEQAVPNPMPVELKETLVKNPTVEKPLFSEITVENVDTEPTTMKPDLSELTEKLRNTLFDEKHVNGIATNKTQITEVELKKDVMFSLENVDPKSAEAKLDFTGTIDTSPNKSSANDKLDISAMDVGSGQTADEADNINSMLNAINPPIRKSTDNVEPFSVPTAKDLDSTESSINPSFVVINHELETPDGIEGPIPVYVKPSQEIYEQSQVSSSPSDTSSTNSNADIDSMMSSKTKSLDRVIHNDDLTPPNTLGANMSVLNLDHDQHMPQTNESCPVCADELPANIGDIYCSADTAVKVAIRRLRKTRLLLNLKIPGETRRLRSTVEFFLHPKCSCLPLDTPGGLALILNTKENILLQKDYSKQALNSSFHIYGVPSVSGVPRQITEIQSICSSQREENIETETPAAS